MEPLKDSCYPSNLFDPFGNEPTHGPCAECKEVYDYGDLTNVGIIVFERYLCPDCLELEPEETDYTVEDKRRANAFENYCETRRN
jgi:hypothetical protein